MILYDVEDLQRAIRKDAAKRLRKYRDPQAGRILGSFLRRRKEDKDTDSPGLFSLVMAVFRKIWKFIYS